VQPISDLSLKEIPVNAPEFSADPLPYFRDARRQHSWLASSCVGFLVHEYRAIRDLLLMDDKLIFSVNEVIRAMGATGTEWATFMEELMINKQGEEHARLRANVALAFSPASINRYRQLIRDTLTEQLDEWAPKGAFDFQEFASSFPIRVICRIIGAPTEVVPGIHDYLEAQGLSFSLNPDLFPTLAGGLADMFRLLDGLIESKRARGRAGEPDLLDQLLDAVERGTLGDYEMRNLLIFLFAAGYDTSKNMLTFIMHEMLERPGQWQRCAEDFDYARKVMNETFRYHSVSNVPRVAKEPIVYRDVLIPAGTVLHFILPLSGRDPDAFPDPDRFDPEREREQRHIAFGLGSHMCLGQYLARAQIEEGVHLIAQRLRRPRRTGQVTWRPFPGVWGIRTLPIAFEPAPARPAS